MHDAYISLELQCAPGDGWVGYKNKSAWKEIRDFPVIKMEFKTLIWMV